MLTRRAPTRSMIGPPSTLSRTRGTSSKRATSPVLTGESVVTRTKYGSASIETRVPVRDTASEVSQPYSGLLVVMTALLGGRSGGGKRAGSRVGVDLDDEVAGVRVVLFLVGLGEDPGEGPDSARARRGVSLRPQSLYVEALRHASGSSARSSTARCSCSVMSTTTDCR